MDDADASKALPALPVGWRWLKVSDVGVVQLGRQRSPKHHAGEFPTKYLRAANITENGLDLSDVMEMNFDPAERERFQLEKDDIVLTEASGSVTQVGKPAIWNDELPLCCFQNTVIRLRPTGAMPRYLFWLFTHFYRNGAFARVAGGVGINHLSASKFSNLPIPIAPTEVQATIVAEIEKQFTRLDAGVRTLRTLPIALSRYRASILDAACNQEPLVQDTQWKEFALRELIGPIGQGWSPKCDTSRDPLPDEWAVITTTAVQPMRYDDQQAKPLPSGLEPRPAIEIAPGDFLMTRKGPRRRAGVACLVRQTRRRLMICDTVYRFRCQESLVYPEYLEIALNSPKVVRAIDAQKAGINESGVSLTHDRLGVVRIPVPDLAEQERIVAEVKQRLGAVENFEDAVELNTRRAERLRQSILQRAFSGQLV